MMLCRLQSMLLEETGPYPALSHAFEPAVGAEDCLHKVIPQTSRVTRAPVAPKQYTPRHRLPRTTLASSSSSAREAARDDSSRSCCSQLERFRSSRHGTAATVFRARSIHGTRAAAEAANSRGSRSGRWPQQLLGSDVAEKDPTVRDREARQARHVTVREDADNKEVHVHAGPRAGLRGPTEAAEVLNRGGEEDDHQG
jgi:hypothetical protein